MKKVREGLLTSLPPQVSQSQPLFPVPRSLLFTSLARCLPYAIARVQSVNTDSAVPLRPATHMPQSLATWPTGYRHTLRYSYHCQNSNFEGRLRFRNSHFYFMILMLIVEQISVFYLELLSHTIHTLTEVKLSDVYLHEKASN